MRILGVDFGLRKTGLAIAEGSLARPLGVLRYKSAGALEAKIRDIIRREKIEKIVVGVSEGEMARKTKEFWRGFGDRLMIPISFQDEILSTKEAQGKAIEAGIKRRKRIKMEDAYAASLILQRYLDNS